MSTTPYVPGFELRDRAEQAGSAGPMPQFNVNYHAEMTYEACPDDPTVKAGLSTIIAANVASDLDQFDSAVHFDNCAFGPGVQRIQSLWQLIESGGVQYNQFVAFGGLLHTTQDFYAHSNWVELHVEQAPIPIWNQDPATLPPQIVSGTFFLDSPKLCGPGAPTHAELNKDSPTSTEGSKVVPSGPEAGKTLFDIAYATAQAATAVQFARLVQVIGAAG